jgi:hypothetical protein
MSVTPLDPDLTGDIDDEDESGSASGTGSPLADLPIRLSTVALLVAVLPFFGQTFHYLKAVAPLWALSKAFPLLTLPLALSLVRQPRPPMARQVLLSFFWLVLCPSFAAIFYFRQDFFTGISAEVKILPMLYFFSFLALLLYVKPTLKELAAAFLFCGAATCILLIVLWAVVPDSVYTGHYEIGSSPLFTKDDRGHRIRAQMYFGLIAMFYCYRRFLRAPQLKWLLGTAIGFTVVFGIVRARASDVGMLAVLLVNGFLMSSARYRVMLLIVAPIGIAALFSFGYLASMFSTDVSSGFDLRWETATEAANFLGNDPIRWIFGVGTISPTNTDSLVAFFNHFFFLGDITWLGILFEFGIIGAALLLVYELRAMMFYRQLRRRVESDFLGSLFDYLLFVVLISDLYPLTLTPGESAVIMAVFAYVWQTGINHDADPDEAEEPEAAPI